MENISSEQELKELLEEGKITEEEYQQLLEAIRQKNKPQAQFEEPVQAEPPHTGCGRAVHSGCGKAALILFILFLALPLMSVFLLIIAGMMSVGFTWGKILFLSVPFILISLLCGLLAFILGIIGWKTASGKIAALGVPITGLLVPVFLILVPFIAGLVAGFRYRISSPVPAATAVIHRPEMILHQSYPLDSLEGLLSQDMAVIDENVFTEGSGSLRIEYTAPGKKTIRLFETGPMSIENRMLIYSAKLRVSGLVVKAYLEMLCDIPGKGEFFSRSIDNAVTGSTEWTTVQMPFRLEPGQMPANVKLNLVVEGTGTVWIDDIELLSNPL